ncbi:MAG: STAS domain-containing protein [Bacilli bacterium]|nr:STAS domain-containing protein [Bacilli bacterium]MBO6284998.1 STAS domain-containing protein [Bacilli bacterium]
MEHKLNNGTLTIFLKGKINSSNSEEAEQEINRIIADNSFTSLVFDLGELVYISSAGLRILLGVKQEHDDTKLVNVSDAIYEILVMVGFDSVLTIERQ